LKDYLTKIKGNLNNIAIKILEQDLLNKSDEIISESKTFSSLLEKEIKENFKKENNIAEIKKILLQSLEKPFYDNLLTKYYLLIYNQDNEYELNKKKFYSQNSDENGVFSNAKEVVSILEKRYEFLEDFPPLKENQITERDSLKEIINFFSQKFLNNSKEI